ncbi:hypothetical protein Psi02_28780 [Planotetraspora silvatica]|uniref:Uncharacterized protein n=1 Tax=Planotetraspora silvatica TaxID=234614 RepID=A0A8J3UQD2_9ACTN|nr:hypothetical protein [Planotetraspora silvatica]GII46454.1 hypothetical protein Psi02_28780 [Planotetraspora silvatica]
MNSDDDRLEGTLSRAVEFMDPLPSWLVPPAVAAHAMRSVDDELARLTFDSLAGPLLVRTGGGTRLLAYECGGTTVEVEVVHSGAGTTIVGRLVPPRPAEIIVETGTAAGTGIGGSRVAVRTDSLGRFTCGGVSPGPFRLRCRLDDTVVVTEWTGDWWPSR